MGGYKKPQKKLHREFAYLNHDSVINSLSALEDGKIDEIIEKAQAAKEGGAGGELGYGPIKAKGDRRKTISTEEQLVRTRTAFSAFDAWFRKLEENQAFGELSDWDEETRNELETGDTVMFYARVELAPLHQVLLTFMSFADQAGNADSPFKQPANKVAEIKKQARMMAGWMRGSDGGATQLVYISPLGIDQPRMVARLDDVYIIGGGQGISGEFTVIGQIEQLIDVGESLPIMRIIRDIPPTPMETETLQKALAAFSEPAKTLGVDIDVDTDLTLRNPTVVLKPIALFR